MNSVRYSRTLGVISIDGYDILRDAGVSANGGALDRQARELMRIAACLSAPRSHSVMFYVDAFTLGHEIAAQNSPDRRGPPAAV